MNKETTANKNRAFSLYGLALERIKECSSKNGIIAFPDIFQKLCRNFSITKKQAWEILFILKKRRQIKIIPFHGVMVK